MMASPIMTADEQLMGAEVVFGGRLLGHVEGLLHDRVSRRVRRIILTYGRTARRVAVPFEWITKRSSSQLVLGVGTKSLDDLPDQLRP
jgi:hypothetical protein